jgi:phage terminase large subunit
MSKPISLQDIIGKGYAEFWNTKKTYVVCKGSRGSKKSKTAALWHIVHMMKFPLSNTLVIRKVERTLRDSAFSDLRWAIDRLGVTHLWQCTTSPLEIIYKPTGQKILFRGLDNPLKNTSISVPYGVLNFLWVEEAYEILKEEDFDIIDESIRGVLPDGYFQRVTITFNPWSEMHWLKKRFFDIPQDNVLAMTTTYKCNEWLSETDIAKYEDIKRRNPNRARVACDGDWGIAEGLIFDNWRVEDLSGRMQSFDNIYCGIDFGYAVDPNALIKVHVDITRKVIYVFDEYYRAGMTDEELVRVSKEFFGRSYVICDSADPKTIDYLAAHGLNAVPAAKGADSINRGIRWLLGYEIIIDKKCINFLNEISQYHWLEDKYGNTMAKPVDENNHLLDALRYATEPLHLDMQIKAGKRIF